MVRIVVTLKTGGLVDQPCGFKKMNLIDETTNLSYVQVRLILLISFINIYVIEDNEWYKCKKKREKRIVNLVANASTVVNSVRIGPWKPGTVRSDCPNTNSELSCSGSSSRHCVKHGLGTKIWAQPELSTAMSSCSKRQFSNALRQHFSRRDRSVCSAPLRFHNCGLVRFQHFP